MKKPAQIKPWRSVDELAVWVREAPSREAYQKRLCVWLTQVKSLHAWEIADMLQVSRQAVWLWIGQYNKNGPEGLARKGRGGRRWSLLPWAQEQSLVHSLEKRALRGEILSVAQILGEMQARVGKEVSLAYVYRLLHRHGWRKLGPRPRHVKANREVQEEFKKNSRPSFRKR
jgi:transposase